LAEFPYGWSKRWILFQMMKVEMMKTNEKSPIKRKVAILRTK
jgi:hypothetical protein